MSTFGKLNDAQRGEEEGEGGVKEKGGKYILEEKSCSIITSPCTNLSMHNAVEKGIEV